LIAEHQTLVFYMGLVSLPVICENLIKHGMSGSMPLAVISKGTLPEQRVMVSTLAKAAEDVAEAKLAAPTIIIIGDVVRLHHALSWSK
jgi:siroheme synthase